MPAKYIEFGSLTYHLLALVLEIQAAQTASVFPSSASKILP